MLVDDVTVRFSGGRGGPGIVGFNRIPMHLGPTGGNGGPGGDVYVEGVNDLAALQQFRFNKEFKAGDGKQGTTPMEAEAGQEGESFPFRLELKMIADVGLVGLPNAGKSSLLNALTGAHSKIGNYAFTTLEPHLGAYFGLILADIPGLIEGASEGKGLGDKFLRHIERTRAIFHLISAESDDVARDYRIVREELKKYNPALVKKNEQLILSKADMADAATLKKQLAALKKLNKNAVALSVIDDESLAHMKKILNTLVRARQELPLPAER